jgi:hypothetical protein
MGPVPDPVLVAAHGPVPWSRAGGGGGLSANGASAARRSRLVGSGDSVLKCTRPRDCPAPPRTRGASTATSGLLRRLESGSAGPYGRTGSSRGFESLHQCNAQAGKISDSGDEDEEDEPYRLFDDSSQRLGFTMWRGSTAPDSLNCLQQSAMPDQQQHIHRFFTMIWSQHQHDFESTSAAEHWFCTMISSQGFPAACTKCVYLWLSCLTLPCSRARLCREAD